MEYQEIVTAYKNQDLDISSLKQKLEIAQSLNSREKYRAINMCDNNIEFNNFVIDMMMKQESLEKREVFFKEIEQQLIKYFKNIILTIENYKAWKIMKIKASDYDINKFEDATIEEKFKILFFINQKYINFLEYQKVADLKNYYKFGKVINDDKIFKLAFLIEMFNAFKNEDIKKELFCFDNAFLFAVLDFRKSKIVRMDEFMATKGKSVQYDYEKYLMFFKNEDFRDITENIVLTSKTLKSSITSIIDIFKDLSESEAEQSYLKDDFDNLKSLEKKYKRMQKLTENPKEEKQIVKKENSLKDMLQDEYEEQLQVQVEEKDNNKSPIEAIKTIENAKKEIKEKQVNRKRVNKEKVIPLIFSWFEREEITLARRITLKKLTLFFNKIKEIEENTGIRVALFLVTNTGKEETLKRMQEIQKRARVQGLDNIIEGALGAYSTFKIDINGNVIDIAPMSEINRAKIIRLLESPVRYYLSKDIIEKDELNYIRYKFSDRKNNTITSQYLKTVISHLLTDERIRKQPLRFLPYIERNCAGIDVVLKSQLIGISQLIEYYKSKYEISHGMILKINIDTIDNFIGEVSSEEEVLV